MVRLGPILIGLQHQKQATVADDSIMSHFVAGDSGIATVDHSQVNLAVAIKVPSGHRHGSRSYGVVHRRLEPNGGAGCGMA